MAHYLAGDYAGALHELQTYRRLSGQQDQNHLIADCLRALDRGTDRVAESVQAMDPAEVGADRYAEGHLVWAAALADAGDVAGGRAVLRRVLDEGALPDQPEEHDLRLWYVAGDLAERAGDYADARRWFGRLADAVPGAFDVDARLRGMSG